MKIYIFYRSSLAHNIREDIFNAIDDPLCLTSSYLYPVVLFNEASIPFGKTNPLFSLMNPFSLLDLTNLRNDKPFNFRINKPNPI